MNQTLIVTDKIKVPEGEPIPVGDGSFNLAYDEWQRRIRLAEAASRNVKINADGYFRRKIDRKKTQEWREPFYQFLRRLFPSPCWIYCGGRHIAVHAGAPGTGHSWDRQAGSCLFRICESKNALPSK